MNQSSKPIEEFFLETLLKICLVSIVIVIVADYYFTRFFITRSLVVNSMVLFAIVSSLVLYRLGYFMLSVLWIGSVIITAMFYQSVMADSITTSSMAVVMVVGFGFSVLLKGRTPIICHAITFTGMAVVFGWLARHPDRYGMVGAGDILVAGITYGVLYSVIAYSSWQLKQRYDKVIEQQALTNIDLVEKTNEIETQNEELFQTQENLVKLNDHLEALVEARTVQIKAQNERLIRYAYANAHHLRGPVARLLGLVQLSKIDVNLDYHLLFQKMEIQAFEIDEVVKNINRELEA